jgi:hypothetical protein
MKFIEFWLGKNYVHKIRGCLEYHYEKYVIKSGADKFSFSLNFIPLIKAPGIKGIVDFISFDQENTVLKNIGLEYESTLSNTLMVL